HPASGTDSSSPEHSSAAVPERHPSAPEAASAPERRPKITTAEGGPKTTAEGRSEAAATETATRRAHAPAGDGVDGRLDERGVGALDGDEPEDGRRFAGGLVEGVGEFLDVVLHGLGAVQDQAVAAVIDTDRERHPLEIAVGVDPPVLVGVQGV